MTLKEINSLNIIIIIYLLLLLLLLKQNNNNKKEHLNMKAFLNDTSMSKCCCFMCVRVCVCACVCVCMHVCVCKSVTKKERMCMKIQNEDLNKN